MLRLGALLFVVGLFLLAYSLLGVVTTPAAQVRGLPKPVWLVVVVLLPIVGPVAWLVSGRPPRPAQQVRGAERTKPPARPAPDDDEAFLRQLRQRAEEQRRRGEEQRRRHPDAGED